jgi:poly(3-hydroxybutyrate) depolymerase
VTRFLPVIALAAGLLSAAACASPPQPAPVIDIGYTCCDGPDVETAYHPGQTMTMHWTVTHPDARPGHSVLTASLTGPYSDVDTLKATYGKKGAATFEATPLRPAGTPGEKPVSTIAIRPDAAPGYYSLTTAVSDGAGGRVSGGSIVEIRR